MVSKYLKCFESPSMNNVYENIDQFTNNMNNEIAFKSRIKNNKSILDSTKKLST